MYMKKRINEIIIYQSKSGAIELKKDVNRDTIWASLNQIAEIFSVQKAAISKHLTNIFESGELSQKATVSKMETVQTEGKRTVKRQIEFYNLDAIISVGYRINSKTGTNFRQWATKILREHITKGYTINPIRLKKNYVEFMAAVDKVKALLPTHVKLDTESILELVKVFADTWLSLDAYDKGSFRKGETTKKKVVLTAEKLLAAISKFKIELIKRSEATDIFAKERSAGSVEGIIGNVMQSFGGHELYPSVEEKAANLLYFMVKNHPFIDGNKRSGAFSFVWFLNLSGVLNISRLTPAALTALTILIAESNPKDKEKMVGLVIMLLKK